MLGNRWLPGSTGTPLQVTIALALVVAPLAGAVGSVVYVPDREAKIVPDAVEAGHRFAAAIAVDEGHAVFGSPYNDGGGEVLVYERTNEGRALEATLPSPGDGAKFGEALSLDGDRLLVGAPLENVDDGYGAGAAYLYEETSDGEWERLQRFVSTDPENLDRFGAAVELAGELIAVGEPADDRDDRDGGDFGSDGAVHVFRSDGTGYEHEAKLAPPADDDAERLGLSVEIHDGTLIVGGPDDGEGIATPGAVFVYAETEEGWRFTRQIDPPPLSDTINFGQRLAVEGDTLIVGSPGPETWTCCSLLVTGPKGQAFAYTQDDGRWTYEAELLPAMQTPASRHGAAVALEGETAYVAGPMAPMEDAEGLVSVFERTAGVWHQTGQIQHEDAESWDQLGKAIAVEDGVLFAAAPGDDEAGHRAGSVYVFANEAPEVSLPAASGPS